MAEKQERTLRVLAIGEFATDRLLLHDICRNRAGNCSRRETAGVPCRSFSGKPCRW